MRGPRSILGARHVPIRVELDVRDDERLPRIVPGTHTHTHAHTHANKSTREQPAKLQSRHWRQRSGKALGSAACADHASPILT